MKLVRSKIIYILSLLVILFSNAQANIFSPEDFEKLSSNLIASIKTKNPAKTLVILPLEGFLFDPDIEELYPSDGLSHNIVKKNLERIKFSVRPYIDELILVKYPIKKPDPKIVSFIEELQKFNVPLVVVTKNISGSIDDIKHLEVWTWMQLYNHGINLSLSPIGEKQFKFYNREKVRGTYPTFFRGLLSCNSYEKKNSPQNIIASLLVTKLQWFPDTIYIVDQDRGYIKSLSNQFKSLKQETYVEGFVYQKIKERKKTEKNIEKFTEFWENLVDSLNKVQRIELESEIQDPYEQ